MMTSLHFAKQPTTASTWCAVGLLFIGGFSSHAATAQIAPTQTAPAQTSFAPMSVAIQQLRKLGQVRYGTGLGRLLTSEQERVRFDDIRFNGVSIKAPEAPPEKEDNTPRLLSIDGISQRPDRPSGQRTSVWIDGKVYAEKELPYGLSIVRNAKGEVTGLNSVVDKGKVEFAKIGEQITRPQPPEEVKTKP